MAARARTTTSRKPRERAPQREVAARPTVARPQPTAEQLNAAQLALTALSSQLDIRAAQLRAELATVETQRERVNGVLGKVQQRIATKHPELHRILSMR
jgi:hypothetical protein